MATDEVIQQRLGEAPEDEAVKDRLEREHGELLEELRALIPGAQVLFGFLLAIRFTSPFTDLVFTTQAAVAVALVFFALTAWRWWAIALYRKAREQAAAKQT